MAKAIKKRKQGRFIAIFIFELLLLLILVVGIYIFKKMDKLQYDNSQDENIQQNEEVDIDGYRNIALFGVDSRQNELEKSTHSDTIIVASINNKTKDVKLASIYRDTYVKIPDKNKFDKINSAYFRGGYSLALSTMNKNFDLNIKEYVTVNFKAIVNAIDLLGGITIDVQQNEVKYVNGYTRELNRINKTNVPGIKAAGQQTLNGTQATAYARIRYTSGGDYKRTERQRIVIDKVFEKLKGAGLSTTNAFINEVFPNIYTNLSKTELLDLAKDILSYDIIDQTGFPFEPDAHTYNKVSYVFPVDLSANVTKLHEFLFDETDYSPSATVQAYSNEIEAIRQ
jgi:LCP family protein required for cell wall assembly